MQSYITQIQLLLQVQKQQICFSLVKIKTTWPSICGPTYMCLLNMLKIIGMWLQQHPLFCEGFLPDFGTWLQGFAPIHKSISEVSQDVRWSSLANRDGIVASQGPPHSKKIGKTWQKCHHTFSRIVHEPLNKLDDNRTLCLFKCLNFMNHIF